MTQVLEKVVARNIEESELIAASVSPREYQNISISCNTCRRAYTRIWKAYVRPPLRKLRKLGPRWKRATSGGRRLVARGGNRGMKGRTERAEGMQMESYTAEKRILNQQLGRRRANRVDACLPACFSSLGQRRWQSSEICMRICLRFYVLSPSLLTPPPPLFVTGTIDETASSGFCFLLRYPKGRSAEDQPVHRRGWRYKYLFVGIRRI